MLERVPETELKVFCVKDLSFDTKQEALLYCCFNNIETSEMYVLSYYRQIAGYKDVIKKVESYGDINFYMAINEDGYGVYNASKSISRGEFVWDFKYGNINNLYKPFRERNVVFETDINEECTTDNIQKVKIDKK